MHILCLTFYPHKKIYLCLRIPLQFQNLSRVLLHFKRFGGFQNISKSINLVKICTTGKLYILKSYTTFMLNTFSLDQQKIFGLQLDPQNFGKLENQPWFLSSSFCLCPNRGTTSPPVSPPASCPATPHASSAPPRRHPQPLCWLRSRTPCRRTGTPRQPTADSPARR